MAVRHRAIQAMARWANRAAGTASMRPSGAVFGSARVLLYTLLCRPRATCNPDHLSVKRRCPRSAPATMPACWPASPPAFRARSIKHLATLCARVHARVFARAPCPHAGPSRNPTRPAQIPRHGHPRGRFAAPKPRRRDCRRQSCSKLLHDIFVRLDGGPVDARRCACARGVVHTAPSGTGRSTHWWLDESRPVPHLGNPRGTRPSTRKNPGRGLV